MAYKLKGGINIDLDLFERLQEIRKAERLTWNELLARLLPQDSAETYPPRV